MEDNNEGLNPRLNQFQKLDKGELNFNDALQPVFGALRYIHSYGYTVMLLLIMLLYHTIVNTIPLPKDLFQHITTQYAADWKVIGTLLGIPSGELQAIEAGWPTNVKWCCNQMLAKWLEVDTSASWGKLLTVIKSLAFAVSYNAQGNATCIMCMYIYSIANCIII